MMSSTRKIISAASAAEMRTWPMDAINHTKKRTMGAARQVEQKAAKCHVTTRVVLSHQHRHVKEKHGSVRLSSRIRKCQRAQEVTEHIYCHLKFALESLAHAQLLHVTDNALLHVQTRILRGRTDNGIRFSGADICRSEKRHTEFVV